MTVVGLTAACVLLAAPPPASPVDPTLPASVRPVIADAIRAELDPRRGPGNALALLETALAKHPPGSRTFRALSQRKAAVALRRLFLTRDRLAAPARDGLALSTFALLELADPGLDAWLARAWAHRQPGPAGLPVLKIALLAGNDLDRAGIERVWVQRFRAIGVSVEFGPARAADFVIRLRGQGTQPPKGRAHAVQLQLGIEHVIDGRTAWRTAVTTRSVSDTARQAGDAGVDWLTRVGGRDLLFRWLQSEGIVPRPSARLPGHGRSH